MFSKFSCFSLSSSIYLPIQFEYGRPNPACQCRPNAGQCQTGMCKEDNQQEF